MTYIVSHHKHKTSSSLVHRGVNDEITGNDIRRITICTEKKVNIMGIDNHQLCSIPLISTRGISQSQIGPIILIFHQYASYGKGTSLHSPV